jgi:radical SAM-linked protein
MKIRIKFRKYGVMKFIGHLDVMRYFQKLLRRADIPIAYTTGMSPHQIMSFAMPLGIGIESDAEYVDIEITDRITSDIALSAMNNNSVEGIEILSFKELPEKSINAMASICAADYSIRFRDGYMPAFDCIKVLEEMYAQPEINVLKKTKKSEGIVDIKPGILSLGGNNDCMNMCLSCGSALNIKPELVLNAVYDTMGAVLDEYGLLIKRTEIYTKTDEQLKSLDSIGADLK